MPARAEVGAGAAVCRLPIAIAATLALVACATTAPAPKQAATPTYQQDQSGFTVAEDVQIATETRTGYDEAIRLLQQEHYEQGIALLVKVTQSAPNVTAPHIDLGIAYARAGDLDKAEASLSRAVELNPRHPVAYNELGMVYRRKGQFAAARGSYEKAIAVYPGFHYARLNLAILCDLYLADLGCALDNYLAYQLAVPDDKQAAMWIVDLRARTGR